MTKLLILLLIVSCLPLVSWGEEIKFRIVDSEPMILWIDDEAGEVHLNKEFFPNPSFEIIETEKEWIIKLEEADEKVITVPDYSNCPYHGE